MWICSHCFGVLPSEEDKKRCLKAATAYLDNITCDCALGFLTFFHLSGTSRTMTIALRFRIKASTSPDIESLATSGCALRPLAPILPLDGINCKNILKKSEGYHFLPAHSASSHSSTSVELPGQTFSPPDSGLKQGRALILSPLPQVAVHSDHSPQSCHWAGTTGKLHF